MDFWIECRDLDAPGTEWSIGYVDFLKLFEEQIRKAGSHLEVDEVGHRKVGFHPIISITQLDSQCPIWDVAGRPQDRLVEKSAFIF